MDSLELEAVYENGTLRLQAPLPLADGERVRLTVHGSADRKWHSRIGFEWKGTLEEYERLMDDDNHPWAAADEVPES